MFRFNQLVERCCQSVPQSIAGLSEAALNFVYPPACLFCGREIQLRSPHFCEHCLVKFKPLIRDECPRCGAPVGPYANLTNGCGQCRRESFAFDRLIRLGIYEGELRLACLRAKAEGGGSLARGLADLLVEQKHSIFEEFRMDLVVPVPEHWTRRFLHAHYAAEEFSRQLARRLKVSWNRSVLLKSRRTPKQATSPTPLRRQQQQGTFSVSRIEKVRGRRVLLVDDILTTGSTASAAARTLKQAGAKQVFVAVIAVSPLRL